MESSYDEDLSENIFFQVLQNENRELFEKATSEGWVICVPMAGSIPKYALTHKDFLSHILIPSDELPETHFRSLNGKDVRIYNKVVTLDPNNSSTLYNTHVLFEETYYTEDMLKYKVLCIENPFQQYSDNVKCQSGIVTVNTLRDCVDLLWTESCKETLEKIDENIHSFLVHNDSLEFRPLQFQQDAVGSLYTQCLQTALKHSRLREKTNMNRYLLDNVKVSVESYMHHGIYDKLIKGITACTAYEDAHLNKIVRNLSDIQLRDLDIRLDLQDTVPKARTELARVEGYKTVLGKIGCLKRTLSAISKLEANDSQGNIIAADDLLPMLVFLVIKSGLPNWIAHLTFMKEFSYSSRNYHSDHHSFLVTSLEAAIEHIRCGLLTGPAEPESQLSYDEDTSKSLFKANDNDDSLSYLFDVTRMGNIEEVKRILEKKEIPISEIPFVNLCHPLCSCDRCEREVSLNLCNTNPTINTCDDRGLTVLHIAGMYGRPRVVDYLLGLGSNPNKTDYRGSTPLHFAASRGHQNALLLLAHAGSIIDKTDNEGNTPLHYSTSNGHEACVKAVLYFAEHMGLKFDINRANNHGDTPLHNAARWGYENIVAILLEYGADPYIENKRKFTPLDFAHNLHISKLLTGASLSKKSINLSAPHRSESLDFSEESSLDSPRKKSTSGIRPSSTDQIKKVERLLRAVTYGDTQLACFYLGIEPSRHSSEKSCHPLCSCKRTDEGGIDSFGDNRPEALNLNVCDSEGNTALHFAAMYGRTDLVKFLIDAGADTNVQTRSNGNTPLHLACQQKRFACMLLLLESGSCDIDCQDSLGNSALHHASLTGDSKLVEMLLKYCPRFDVKNKEGKTPMEEANSVSVSRLLMNYQSKS
ncbi:hypothetical protein AAG570_012412 [Ranatra chinensis]|uniref:VPS9 domain-containing protein n=1 Tax=Ranatra chinensis TaxID=642074 RepID=A0ABD0YIQ8_9HEMI